MSDNNQIAAELSDKWRFLVAAAVDEFERSATPDPDPQVEATKHSHGLSAAAEIKIGKILAEVVEATLNADRRAAARRTNTGEK